MTTEQTISAKAFLNLLAAFSSALLAWVFGSVIWENVKKIPVIETNLAVLNEKDRRHEADIAENALGISKLYARIGNNKSTFNGLSGVQPGNISFINTLRYVNNVGGPFDSSCRSVYILLPDDSSGEFTALPADWCRTAAGSYNIVPYAGGNIK